MTTPKYKNFHKILADISAEFININIDNIDEKINLMLKMSGEALNVDRGFVFLFPPDGKKMTNVYEWYAEGIKAEYHTVLNLPLYSMPWWFKQSQLNKIVEILNSDSLTVEASAEKKEFKRQKIKSLISVPIFNNENLIGVLGFNIFKENELWEYIDTDILKILSNILAKAQQKLAAEKELTETKIKAEKAIKSKSGFLSKINHEIVTPLNSVIGFTDLLKDTPLNKIQQKYVANVVNSSNDLLSKLNNIFDYAKLKEGILELELSKTDIVDLVEQTTDIFKNQVTSKGLELLLNIDTHVPRFAVVDSIRLKQILTNLLSNALKRTEIGEIEVKLTFAKIDNTTGNFCISVRDTGKEINKEVKKKLYNEFSETDVSDLIKFDESNLSLITANLLAKKMNSIIELISEIGKGSTAYLMLKTDYEAGEKIDYTNLNEIKRVLLIDDNQNNRMILEQTFLSWEIEFEGCDNGFSALKILEISEPFDLIIIDYHMPYLDGFETLKILKRSKNFSVEKQPVILLHSLFDDLSIHEEAKKLGIKYKMTKPVKSRELFYFLKNIKEKEIKNISNIPSQSNEDHVDDLSKCKATILIAEDNKMNMWVIRKMIEKISSHFKIFEAHNGKEALETAIKKKPELIFMDIQMPEMNGYKATELIRKNAHQSLKDVPIIALTAGNPSIEKVKCIAAGMNDLLIKPIEKATLYKLLSKFLNKNTDDNI